MDREQDRPRKVRRFTDVRGGQHLGKLIGKRPSTWQDGDAALEKFVLTDNGAHDRELLMLFNRRHQRAQATNGPAGSAMAHHNPIQPFGGRM